MKRTTKIVGVAAATALAIPIALLSADYFTEAADHLDPPARTDPAVDSTPDRPADIADIYAWHTADNLNLVLTFAGPNAPDAPPTYDRDVLYTINISNDADLEPEFPIQVRFGFDGQAVGVQFANVPGVTGTISGPVETNLTQNGVMARAGIFDDPFFFDLEGFRATRMTGTLSFQSTRDFFAGKNDTAVVLQIPRAAVANGTNPLRVWATTARFGGQL